MAEAKASAREGAKAALEEAGFKVVPGDNPDRDSEVILDSHGIVLGGLDEDTDETTIKNLYKHIEKATGVDLG